MITFLLNLCEIQYAYSQAENVTYSPKIVTGHYYTPGGESLVNILKNEVSLKENISKSEFEEIVISIKKYNPAVTNWNIIPANEKIYLEIPYGALNARSILFAKPVELKKTTIPEADVLVPTPTPPKISKPRPVILRDNKFKYSLILSSSMGTFKESSPSGNEITSKQFSPLTLGLAASILDPVRPWIYSSSFYVSYLRSQNVPMATRITNSSISTPLEIGLTGYAQRMIVAEKMSLYGGFDAEKFSTLNLVELEQGKSTVLSNREHMVLYGTIGTSFFLKIKKQSINLRASYSKSVLSSVNVSNIEAYKGWKSIFYIQVPFNEHFFLNAFYKFHNMSGESELTVTRIGAGIGYTF